jgi:phosphopantothenoylcysteine decarboxylase/phosphopantothenate--cysteine ligase
MANVLLAAGASAALHKACDLASKLAQRGHTVRCVLTPRAAKLVAPQLFEALTGERAYVDEFEDERRAAMDHIDLARWGEVLLVAPATADLVARLALGLGGDLVTTVALAFSGDKPRLVAPAMNPTMLAQGPVRRHRDTLIEDGWQWLAPDEGRLACGDEGAGRLLEPAELLERLEAALA